MRRLWVLILGLVVGVDAIAIADDQSDYASLMNRIDGWVDNARSNIDSARGYQNDNAISYTERALDNAKDVQSAADEARRKDVSSTDKGKADRQYEAARDFPESARAYLQIKRAEIQLKGAAYETTCNELDNKLKEQVDRLVYDKDFEGERKIRELAENQARPIREGLNAVRSQEGTISSWNNTAKRFTSNEDKWKAVKSSLDGAADQSRSDWKALLEKADQVCEKIVKWDENPIVRDGIRALADKTKSKDEYVSEINRQLELASRSLESVERDTNESDIVAAVSAAEHIEDLLYRLKEVRGTDPKATRMTERWPELARQFKDRCGVLETMKQNQFLVDRAQQTCQEAEKELLARIQKLLDSDPFDQNRMALRDQAKSLARDAGNAIEAKLKKGGTVENEMKDLNDKVRDFSPEDAAWAPVTKNLVAAARAMVEYFHGAMNDAHRACDRVALGENDPEVKQIVTGDCSDSQLQSLHDKQVDWCKGKGTRTCKSLNQKSDCQTAKDRLEINEQCVSFRREIMNSCFKGGDARHRRELQSTEEVREGCAQKVKDLCP